VDAQALPLAIVRDSKGGFIDSGKSNCGCGLKAIHGRYDFAFGLKNFGMIKGHICGGCKLGKGALEDGLHGMAEFPSGRSRLYL
jgi:hypothetical protein